MRERFQFNGAFIVVMLMVGLTACRAHDAADPQRMTMAAPTSFSDDVWPARYPDVVVEYTKSIGLPISSGTSSSNVFQGSDHLTRLFRSRLGWFDTLTICRGAFGCGVVFECAYPIHDIGGLYAVFVNGLTPEEFTRALKEEEATELEKERLTLWRFALKLPHHHQSPRGLIIHQVSMAGEKYETPIIEALRMRGWAVLTVSPNEFHLNFKILSNSEVGQNMHADLIASAAAVMDGYLADSAFAVESMVNHLRKAFPDLAHKPAVIMGFSLGALSAPTVAARMRENIQAIVLIGGGANLMRILLEGSLTRDGLSITDRVAYLTIQRHFRMFSDMYLAASRLDPYHTAPAIAHKPVLLLHGDGDQVVPARTGELLRERLAWPERWRFAFGHYGLFWQLPGQANPIADWLDRAVPIAAAAPLEAGDHDERTLSSSEAEVARRGLQH